jgi:hypothetical protein
MLATVHHAGPGGSDESCECDMCRKSHANRSEGVGVVEVAHNKTLTVVIAWKPRTAASVISSLSLQGICSNM